MSVSTSGNGIIFYHKTERGNFKIEITQTKVDMRKPYQDFTINFSIDVKNEDYPEWKVKINNVTGRISRMEDRDKLIEKLTEEIKFIINKDEQGDCSVGAPTMDLTVKK
jgi:uncharacterized membrane-anchored protein YjiN (DUF445 family)